MSLELRKLSPELEEIAKSELKEEAAKIQEYLNQFREWIKKSPHVNTGTDDQFLITFLRNGKYSLERAKQKLDMYHTIRTHTPEFYANRDPMDLKLLEIIKLG
jgi:hypothetical protein